MFLWIERPIDQRQDPFRHHDGLRPFADAMTSHQLRGLPLSDQLGLLM